jgi:hypothetical protein
MRTLDLLAYASNAWVLGTYAWLARRGAALPFHFANALGAAPLIAIEIRQEAWPVIPLTGTFCAIGWIGLVTEYRNRKARSV